VHFHHVLRHGDGVSVEFDREHDSVVGQPILCGVRPNQARIIEGGDAAFRTIEGGQMEWAVIDEYASPGQPSPVDISVLIGKKWYPTQFDQLEDLCLEPPIARWCGSIPGQEMVGGGGPDRSVFRDRNAGRGNPGIGSGQAERRCDWDEPQKIREKPGQARIVSPAKAPYGLDVWVSAGEGVEHGLDIGHDHVS
jgi:hypothetical protein